MSHKVNLVEFGGDVFDFAHHPESQGFVLEVLNIVKLFLVPLFEKPLVVCGQFVTKVALDLILCHTRERVFTHVNILGKARWLLVLRVLPVLFIVHRHHINRIVGFYRVAHVVQLGVIGLLLVRTLHIVVMVVLTFTHHFIRDVDKQSVLVLLFAFHLLAFGFVFLDPLDAESTFTNVIQVTLVQFFKCLHWRI